VWKYIAALRVVGTHGCAVHWIISFLPFIQERNGTCGMKPECSGRNLAEKSRTDRDLKWDEICSIFWIGMKCFSHSGRNGTELTTLKALLRVCCDRIELLFCYFF
jgi:hypothetical protein